jgi:ABC-type branched-subunit amino acid transport system ATPase component
MISIILETDNLYAGYGTYDVLKGVSIKIKESQIVSIIGPNGAGKSTLFRAIFGIIKYRGKIFFQGEDIEKLSSKQILLKGISYVPQGRCNFPWMTIEENLEMGAFTLKNSEKVKRGLKNVFNLFPLLEQKRTQDAGTLSGGEQQILEMAMSLLLKPKIVLLDEPSLGLAPKYRNMVFEEIKRMNHEGITLILVEQNATLALNISNYAYVLELGKNKYEGPAREIMNDEKVKKLYLGGD